MQSKQGYFSEIIVIMKVYCRGGQTCSMYEPHNRKPMFQIKKLCDQNGKGEKLEELEHLT